MSDTNNTAATTAEDIATAGEQQIVTDLGLDSVPDGAHDEDVAAVQSDLDNGATPEQAQADLVGGVESTVMLGALLDGSDDTDGPEDDSEGDDDTI